MHLEFKALIKASKHLSDFCHSVELKWIKQQLNEACCFPWILLRHQSLKSFSGWDQRIKALSGTFPDTGSGGLFVFLLFWPGLERWWLTSADWLTCIVQRNYFWMCFDLKSQSPCLTSWKHQEIGLIIPRLPQEKWWMAVKTDAQMKKRV